jgi:hypothetical protein
MEFELQRGRVAYNLEENTCAPPVQMTIGLMTAKPKLVCDINMQPPASEEDERTVRAHWQPLVDALGDRFQLRVELARID